MTALSFWALCDIIERQKKNFPHTEQKSASIHFQEQAKELEDGNVTAFPSCTLQLRLLADINTQAGDAAPCSSASAGPIGDVLGLDWCRAGFQLSSCRGDVSAVTRRQVTGIFSRRTRRGAALRWDPEGRSRRRRRRSPTCGSFPSSCLLPSRRSTAPACPGRRCARSWRRGRTWFALETEGFLLSDTQRGENCQDTRIKRTEFHKVYRAI